MQPYLLNNYDLNDIKIASACDEFSLWSSYPGVMLLDAVRFKEHATILDVGFGTGFPLIEIAQRFGASAKVYGIDPWDAATLRTKEKIAAIGVDNITLTHGYAESLPYPDEQFDLIVSNMGFNNTTDQLKAMQACFRTAKHGSQMVFTVNLPASMKEFYSLYAKALRHMGLKKYITAMNEHIHHKRKSYEENVDLIKESGFTVVEVKKSKFSMRFLNGTAYLNHNFTKLAFLESWINILPPDRVNEFFSVLEAKLNDAAKVKGFLNISIPLVCFDCKKI